MATDPEGICPEGRRGEVGELVKDLGSIRFPQWQLGGDFMGCGPEDVRRRRTEGVCQFIYPSYAGDTTSEEE